ncbi:MAG: hypothetical protein CL760_08290 [Chloroflexi bacterium]|nr:hypothetical protein [Chloroflexota bacterium]MQG05261.1 NUDIX domain-containing protein [SAR202 cluster bacterium]|tara:strand:+ start:1682 stop:2152 length:471 start_codon:yes stop_codon:yes gene_type:complete
MNIQEGVLDNSSKNLPNRNVRVHSSGGVVYRRNHDSIDIVGCVRHHPHVCALPKGTPYKTENIEQTALREVQEETGLQVKIDRFIDKIEYTFFKKEERCTYYKTVYFFLMVAVGGSFFLHDNEFDVVKWIARDKISVEMSYENEVKIIEKGISMVG